MLKKMSKGKSPNKTTPPARARLQCGTPKNILSVTHAKPSVQEEFLQCPYCYSAAGGNGWRKRHVIQQGEQCWYWVRRGICRSKSCGKNFTVLLGCMLPNKHYAAQEIEESIAVMESGAAVDTIPCGAEESTLRRWRREYGAAIPKLTGKLEALARCLLQKTLPLTTDAARPLNRLRAALTLLELIPSNWTVLGRAFFHIRVHPVCIG